jgi:hypothetical protein
MIGLHCRGRILWVGVLKTLITCSCKVPNTVTNLVDWARNSVEGRSALAMSAAMIVVAI